MIINPTNQILWPLGEKLLRLALGVTLTLLIARQLGPHNFGVFSNLTGLLMILLAVAGLGVKDVLIDEIASGRMVKETGLASAGAMQSVVGAALYIIFLGYAIMVYGFGSTEFLITLVIGVLLILKGCDTLIYILEAHGRLRVLAVAQGISLLFGTAAKVLILLNGATLILFSLSFTIEFVALYGIIIWLSERNLVFSFYRAIRSEAIARIFRRSWPLMLSSVSVISYFYVDQIILAYLLDSTSAGVYAAATKISQQLYVLPAIVVGAYFPRLTMLSAESIEKFETGLDALLSVLILSSLAVIICVFLLADVTIDLLLGEQYRASAMILKVHSIGLVFIAVSVLTGRWYVMNNLSELALVRQLLTACLNIGLNFIFVPFFGIFGSALATLISLFFLAFGVDALNKTTRKLLHFKIVTVCSLFSVRKCLRSVRLLRDI